MTQGWALNIGNRTAVSLDFKSVGARGLFSPRPLIGIHFDTSNERTTFDLHDVRIRFETGQEYLGDTRLTGECVTSTMADSTRTTFFDTFAEHMGEQLND